MLPHLSSDTWGLVISADDGPSGVLGAQQTPSMKYAIIEDPTLGCKSNGI
jgi:hypothetical protein